MSLATELQQGLEYQDLTLEQGACAKLIRFVELLHKWNKVYNLTAVRHPLAMVSRHILDSLTLKPYLSAHERIVDLGSGGGLPGIPMAIVYPEKQFTLIDSNQKKTRFLVQALSSLELTNVQVRHDRVEAVQLECPADCVTARAFAAPQQILAYADSLCARRSEVILMTAKTDELDLSAANGFDWQSTDAVQVYNDPAQRHIVRFVRANAS